ncbi:bacteriophage antitermination protein Q [Cronobacter dublinensis]|uniref:bacteriophage antitermination protein Q n=1 Tax=Cronobacter dublinensis TaxID=413497 RepID=UPI0024C366EF|nr:bacteriophage antitermination protein Q [Cronobacter dublinensis]MDK1192394.1 bacteriophage antitermination protein Q [Cronobacter dublinensis]MDK1203380.1 bacteriophage antitermination protein Q [Cronobacter dublinensis]
MAGVTAKNWWKGYARHWEAIREIFDRLDVDALLKASKKRQNEKRENLMPSLAKVDF